MALYAQGVEIYLAPTADSDAAIGGSERPRSTSSRGGSAIYSPLGQCLAGPAYDEQAILHADLDLGEVMHGKFDFDVAGHYARPDIFSFSVNDAPQVPVRFTRRD